MEMPVPRFSVQIKVESFGRAPKARHGENVYKFAEEQVRPMESNGWFVTSQTRHYVFMRSPPSQNPKGPLILTVKIPDKKQIEDFALELHNKGQRWFGYIGVWQAYFVPSEERQYAVEINLKTRLPIGSPRKYMSEPEFHIGATRIWSASVRWQNEGVKFWEMRDNLIENFRPETADNSNAVPTLEQSDLYEGALSRANANSYERNRRARQMCIEYYGSKCAICAIDFGRVYGHKASGLIHVHHLLPLSKIREHYQVDPIKDLIPVCPNCHMVIHSQEPPYGPDDVRSLLAENRKTI